MRKSKLKLPGILFSIFISAAFSLFVSPQPAEAINCAFSPSQLRQGDGTGGTFNPRSPNVTFSFPLFNPANPTDRCQQAGRTDYKFQFQCSGAWPKKDATLNPGTGNLEFTFNWSNPCELEPGDHQIRLLDGALLRAGMSDEQATISNPQRYTVQAEPGGGFGTCKITFGPPEGKKDFSINDRSIQAYIDTSNLKDTMTYSLSGNALGISTPAPFKGKEGPAGIKTFNLNNENTFAPGTYALTVSTIIPGTTTGRDVCSERFNVTVGGGGTSGGGPAFQVGYCDPANTVVNTAIGCIPTDPGGFVSFMFKYLLGLSGMIAFFLILTAGFQILTSAGNPEKLQGGQQLLTAAVIGVIVLVFSVVILQIIGTNILGGLPGFPTFN